MLAVPIQALFGQLLIGLINGSFYALLSLGLAIIFGLLNVINFCHGALYMLGAFVAWFLLEKAGIGYWPALILAPLAVGLIGVLIERALQGLFSNWFGSSGMPYEMPRQLLGGQALGFMFLPNYRVWVIAVSLVLCLGTWAVIE